MASKGYDFVLTLAAETDIDEAITYISEFLDNPDAASNLADELESQLEEICKNPKTGRIIENEFLRRNDVRRFLVKNYIAYYIIDEDNKTIVVLRFVYGKCDQDPIVKGL
ncbi:type II toxin-antitoxin system RelE/ParE family toxin [Butyrivibrio proteoclasticus]|uniref:type II toxin-antitoxin system RelE/ParE family toxin n=1 Tax=Butyrivibrio proteoclasticus TaxID=43305 RepID=UPI00047923C5|nr:type II toxin-antitoxin system RelE/ParE family toxin [Butyrivibrio proteoclasticus]